MSVQLIVYPQNYDGFYNEISSSPTEFLVNGLNFSGLDNTSSYDSAAIPPISIYSSSTLLNAPPTIINTWYRFRSTYAGTPNLPTVTAGNLVLSSTTTDTHSGVYQQLSNLTIGSSYTITVNIDVSTTGYVSIVASTPTSSSVGYSTTAVTSLLATATSISLVFTAQSQNDVIGIIYKNTVADTVIISSTSIQPVIGAIPSGATNVLENGQVLCDLYEDEDIPLSLSVDDFKNVAEKVQSYSKAFNLPATKRNNRIFDNIFEITRSNDGVIFNPYKKTKCVLKQDGFILFEGYLRMLDVTDKKGETSYNVNLYSEVVALADVLGDRAFRDLDFTELGHDYNYTEIKNSWQGILTVAPLPVSSYANNTGVAGATTTNVLRYPFVSWNHQYGYTSSGMPKLPNLESSFRPFISIKYLIDRIFEATPFTYESAFFDTDDFKRLFMDFNWGADNTPANVSGSSYAGRGTFSPALATSSFTNLQLVWYPAWNYILPPNYDDSTNVLTATQINETYAINYDFVVGANPGEVVDFQWLHTSAAGVAYTPIDIYTITSPATNNIFHYTGSFTIVMQTGDTLQAQFKTNGTTTVQLSGTGTVIFVQSISAVTSQSILQTLRGELGQWDFLKGLITMFNLVTLPDEDNPNNIKIEPYSDVFINSTDSVQLDWTEKIDVSEMKLTPLTDLNKKTIFKFVEDDDDYSFNQYKNQVGGHLYGSKKYNAGDEFNILFGEDEIVAEPFAATVVKPLMDNFPDFITPAIYSYNLQDDTSQGFDNSPRIMYNNGVVTMASATYSVPAQNGVAGDAFEDEFLQFSHLTDIPTSTDTLDFHFGECQLMPGVGAATPNNLFNLYWLPYYSELYNPNTRIMTIKVNLNPADINRFKFNDTVYIKNRVFRVNKIDYKPNDLATVEFILIP